MFWEIKKLPSFAVIQRTGDHFLRYHLFWQRILPTRQVLKKTPRTGNGVQPLWSTERSSRCSAYSQRLPCRSRFLPVFQLPPALCECAGRFTSFSSIYVVLTFGYTLIYHVLFCLSTQIFWFAIFFAVFKNHFPENNFPGNFRFFPNSGSFSREIFLFHPFRLFGHTNGHKILKRRRRK